MSGGCEQKRCRDGLVHSLRGGHQSWTWRVQSGAVGAEMVPGSACWDRRGSSVPAQAPARRRWRFGGAVGAARRLPCDARSAGPAQNSLRAPAERSVQTAAPSQFTRHACPAAGMQPGRPALLGAPPPPRRGLGLLPGRFRPRWMHPDGSAPQAPSHGARPQGVTQEKLSDPSVSHSCPPRGPRARRRRRCRAARRPWPACAPP